MENTWGKHTKYLPYVFTEQGVSMLSAVLRSKVAIEVSIQIIETFVNMRKFISSNALIFQRLETLENKQSKNDEKFEKLFDVYSFVSCMIKSAKYKIISKDKNANN